MAGHAAIVQCAIFVRFAKIMGTVNFFSPFDFLMAGHAAIMRCAIFVRFAKYFFLLLML